MRFEQNDVELLPEGLPVVQDIVSSYVPLLVLPRQKFYLPMRLDFNYLGPRRLYVPVGGGNPLQVAIFDQHPADYLARYGIYGRMAEPDLANGVELVDGLDDQLSDEEARKQAFRKWAGHGVLLHCEFKILSDYSVETSAEVAIMETEQESAELALSSGREVFEERHLGEYLLRAALYSDGVDKLGDPKWKE